MSVQDPQEYLYSRFNDKKPFVLSLPCGNNGISNSPAKKKRLQRSNTISGACDNGNVSSLLARRMA